jgi:hypothetical protein
VQDPSPLGQPVPAASVHSWIAGPSVCRAGFERSLTDRQRELLANVNPRDEFPVARYMTYTDHGDGSITVSLPWTDFRVRTHGDRQEAMAEFGRRYFDLLRSSEAERDAVRRAMDERGYVPVAKRNELNGRDPDAQ